MTRTLVPGQIVTVNYYAFQKSTDAVPVASGQSDRVSAKCRRADWIFAVYKHGCRTLAPSVLSC